MVKKSLVLATLLATGVLFAQDATFDDIMGDDYYEVADDASAHEQRKFARSVGRNLLDRVSDSYWRQKHALDANWSNGTIDRVKRDALLATLDETTKALRGRVRGSGHEDMARDVLLTFAQGMAADTDQSFDSLDVGGGITAGTVGGITAGAGGAVGTDSCHCFKTRYLDENASRDCQAQVTQISPQGLADLTAACRSADIRDPLADAVSSCANYADEFSHELTGERMTRRVEPGASGCRYLETIPGDLQMACVWTTASERKEISNYFRYAEFYADASMTSRTEFRDGEPVTETRYELDGKDWHNPLQDDMQDGTCVVGKR